MLNSPARWSKSSRIREETWDNVNAALKRYGGCRIHHFTLRDELCSIELSHNTLQHLISNGGENPFVVVQPKTLVDFGEMLNVRAREHSEGDGDHLQVFRPCCC